MRRAVAVCFLWLVSIAQDTGDAERIDFSTTLVNRVSSDEEVVQGTISLNGTITPESVSKLNWAAQNALVQACGHGSKVIANAVLQLSWVTRRGVDIKFFVLPRLGGGGDCARTLVEGSAGAFEPPFQVSGALRKPIFRNMIQNELELLGFGALMSDMYLRLWRITCDVQPVWRNGNSLTEQNPVTICGTYASGWEVYFEPSITEPATAVGVSLGYSAGNTGSVAQQFSDKCMVANSPCFCSSMSSCGWRRKEDGVGMHCKTLDSSDTATPVTCDACAQQPGCPPSCSSASYPCHCASIEATCRWDVTTGVCLEGPAPNGEDVPCSSCSLQDRCQALRPRALEFRPNSIFALTREGPKSLIEVDFNVALALPAVAARAAARFLCGTDGFDPLANSLQLLEYVVPPEALLVEGRTLKLASGTVQVVEPTRCTLILSGGVVSSRDDGLPSQPVEFGEYYFNMKDSVPPQVAAFWPANGAGSVPTVTQWITISFSERIRATESFEALLTRTDVMGEPADPPVAVSLHSVHQRTMTLAIQGLLGPGRFYQLTISDKSIIDYGSLAFEGITAGAYKFKTEGTYEEVQVIEAPAESLPGAAIAGIVGGAVVLLLTALFLCYRGYIAASEKDDLVHVIEQDDNNKKKNKKEKSNEPPAIFGSDAIRDMQIDQLPETPDNRKQGAVLFAFDEDGEDPLRKAAAMEEGTTRTNRRVSRASLRAEAFAEAHPELSQGLPGRPSVASNQPTNERHGHHHSNERSGRHGSNEHSGRHGSNERSGHHSNERGSNERSGHHGSNERSGHHSNERSNRPSHGRHSVHSNQVPEDVRPPTSSKKEEPKKEPPKMKPGFFLGAWDG